jgi:hypothetical protein
MTKLKRILQFLIAAIVVAIVVIQFLGPVRSNPISPAAQAVEAHLQLNPQVSSILSRSCGDCHSNNTQWPWYSHVAPVSWFVIDHVNHGRSHLNFSEWGRFSADESREMLEHICKEVKSGSMPLTSYTRIHTGAKLSQDDVGTLCDWANSQLETVRRVQSEEPNDNR